jgi:Zn-dependent protease with chaperone function
MRPWVPAVLCALLLTGALGAQHPAAPPALPAATTPPSPGSPTSAVEPGSHADDASQDSLVVTRPDATTDPTTRVPVPEPSEKALRYHRSGNWLWAVGVAWGLLVPAVILFTGFSARLRDMARAIGRRWYFTLVAYVALYTALMFVIDLPLSYYAGFVRPHEYGLSNQTFDKWFSDSLKELAVGLVAGALLIWIPYLLLAKSPRRWWFYTSLAAIPVMFLLIFVTPMWIDPLFNDFGPMKDKVLEARILHLADRAGIEGGRVFEVNKSVDTKAVNAYVTGFMGSKRIVLWDTIIAKLTPDQLLFVMGHEMGHYVLGHVWKTIVFLSLVGLVTLYVAHRLAQGIITRHKARFGFDRLGDVASLPLLLLLLNFLGFFVTPVVMWHSRQMEHESDTFGLEITQNNNAAAMAFVRLQQENLGVPRPGWIVRTWRASHPVAGDRIDFANDYHPWRDGHPLVYGERFR